MTQCSVDYHNFLMLFLCMIASVNSFYHSLSIDTEILLSAMQRNLINGIIELNFSGNFFFSYKINPNKVLVMRIDEFCAQNSNVYDSNYDDIAYRCEAIQM